MTNFNSLFRNLRRGESHLSTSCLRLASNSPLSCLLQLRYAAMVLLLTIGVGNAYADTWTKVTSEPDSWAGEYLLVYENSSTSGSVWTGVDAASCYVSATISSGVISTKPDGAVSLIIAAMTGGYSIKVSGGTNNNKYIKGTSGSNALGFDASAQLNTISYDKDCSDIVSNTSHIRWNTNRFRYYKSSTYTSSQKVQLYKKSASCDKKVALTKGAQTNGTISLSHFFALFCI